MGISIGKERAYLELSKTTHSQMTDYLLSAALIEYQLRGDEIDTLENMPPSVIAVIDRAEEVSSASVQDRLTAWTGDYRMYRRDNQLFIVFSDEKLRNSAMTEMKKGSVRKATKADSLNVGVAHKKKVQRRKKIKAEKAIADKAKGGIGDSFHDGGDANKEWKTVGNSHAISKENMKKKKAEYLDVKMGTRF